MTSSTELCGRIDDLGDGVDLVPKYNRRLPRRTLVEAYIARKLQKAGIHVVSGHRSSLSEIKDQMKKQNKEQRLLFVDRFGRR